MGKTALLIGINYFGTSSELNGCINDVWKMESLLQQLGWTCIKMVDSLSKSSKMYPSTNNMLRQMRKLIRRAKSGDQLFVHYSGHGTYTHDTNGDESDRRDEALCPVEGPVITDDTLRQVLVDQLPADVCITMLLDCCHSGTGADLHYNYEDTSYVKKKMCRRRRIPDEYKAVDWISRHSRRVNSRYEETPQEVYCISGCRDNQTSADTVFDGKYSGAMTAAFVRAWKEHSKNGKANIRDVLQYITCMLRCYRYQQIPQLSMSQRRSDMLYAINQCYLQL